MVNEARSNHLFERLDLRHARRRQLIDECQPRKRRDVCAQQIRDLATQLQDLLEHLVADVVRATPSFGGFVGEFADGLEELDSVGAVVEGAEGMLNGVVFAADGVAGIFLDRKSVV